ncbi:MAG: M14-type cytosolic carboxypeptidase, partial [Armatimonadota bacterium]|nr:M14-type cytosolic carboxypeptidase [Armatimonadota bacterium]
MLHPRVCTDFPGGQLGEHQWTSPTHLRAVLYREWDEKRLNTQATWYYFRLDGVKGVPLTVELTGLNDRYEGRPSHSVAEHDMPFVSDDNIQWRRLLTAQFHRERATLTLHVTPQHDTLWVAHLEPYTAEHLDKLLADHAGSRYLTTENAGKTVEGRALPLWSITDPTTPDDTKRVVWLMARQHAWETHTSWCVDGLVRFLLADTPAAAMARRRLLVRLFPMMDPDGVARGGTRFNRYGYDLNRHWDWVDPSDPSAWEKTPEIAAGKKAIADWLESGRPIDLFLAFHDTQHDVLMIPAALSQNAVINRLLEEMCRHRFTRRVHTSTAAPGSTVHTALYHLHGIT